MLFVIGLSPLAGDWISIKLIMVVIYILLGMVVLHFGKTPVIRRLAWLGALMVFACIVWLAHFKEILPLAM